MMPLTLVELTRIEFLYSSGVENNEIIEDINSTRRAEEEDCTMEVDFYIQCVLEVSK
jgi:hypothetical protein